MKNLIWMLCLTGLILTAPLLSQAAIYKYVDDSGRMVFVDDEDKIPLQYRSNTAQIKEEKASLSTEEQGAAEEEKATQIYDRDLQNQAQAEARRQEKRRAYQTPVMVRGSRVLVPVEVAMGDKVTHLFLLLDPGASSTVFYRDPLAGLELPSGDLTQTTLPGGKSIAAEKIAFSYLDIGPFHERNFTALLIDTQGPRLPYDGMLGLDFLKQHPYQVNYETERILWDID